GHDNVQWSRQALEEDGLTAKDYYAWPEKKRFEFFISRTQYGKRLDALPKGLRDAHLLGRWDVFAGQFFQNFDRARHVISQQEATERIKPWHTRWMSGDWGYADAF